MNRYGSPVQENGKITRILQNTWCHQCKMKHKKIVVCNHFWSNDKETKCNGRYCANCCKRHYGDELSQLENLDSWICYKCTSICVCAACRRLRNEEKNISQKSNKRKNKSDSEEDSYSSENIQFEMNLRSKRRNETKSDENKVSQEKVIIPKKKIQSNQKKMINNPKIWIPTQEDLDKSYSTKSPFDLLLEASNMESQLDQQSKIQSSKRSDIHKLLNEEETPNSQNIIQLKREVSNLTNELNNMREDFNKLRRLFFSFVQSSEGSSESSPIEINDNLEVDNFSLKSISTL